MKELIQNLKVLRAMSGRFLAVAVLAAMAFPTTIHAQTDPGQGAIVIHIDRDATSQFTAVSPDGQLRLDVAISGQSDYFRLNPDGTLTFQTVESQAPMTLSALGSGGVWEPMLSGYGTLHFSGLVDDERNSTGEAVHLTVLGHMTKADGSQWLLHVVAVEKDQEFKVLTVDYRMIPVPRP